MLTKSISLTSFPANGKSGEGTCCSQQPPIKHYTDDAAENTISFVSYSSSSSNYISFKSHIQDCSSPYFGNSRNTLRKAGSCIVFNNKTLKGEKLKILNALLDKRLTIFLIIFASIIIINKMVIVSMPLASSESVLHLKEFAEDYYHSTIEWANEHNVPGIIQPLLCGLAVAIVGYALVYLDSDVPGVNPPSIYSPKRKMQYYQHKSSVHLGYLTAIAAGVVIAVIKYLDI